MKTEWKRPAAVALWTSALFAGGCLFPSHAGMDGDIEFTRVIPVVLRRHDDSVRCVAFAPENNRLVSASTDGTVILWNVETKEADQQLQAHEKGAWCVAVSSDGKQIASGGADRLVKLWDAAEGGLLHTFEGHHDYVKDVAYAPGGEELLSAGYGGEVDADPGEVRLWSLTKSKEPKRFTAASGGFECVAAGPDGKKLYAGGLGVNKENNSRFGAIHVWNIETGELNRTLRGHTGPVLSIAFAPDGDRLASGDDGGVIKIWDVKKGEAKRTFNDTGRGGDGHAVHEVAFRPDGEWIAAATSGFEVTQNLGWGEVRIWEVESGRLLYCLKAGEEELYCLAFSPDGSYLAAGDHAGHVYVWEVSQLEEYRR